MQATHSNQEFTDGSAEAAHYANDLLCSWTITVPAGGRAQLSFSRFALEPASLSDCDRDWVELFDGPNADAPSLGRYCGTDSL